MSEQQENAERDRQFATSQLWDAIHRYAIQCGGSPRNASGGHVDVVNAALKAFRADCQAEAIAALKRLTDVLAQHTSRAFPKRMREAEIQGAWEQGLAAIANAEKASWTT